MPAKRTTKSKVVYDATPTFQLGHRPFFSIIVPCYNSTNDTLGVLLNSITEQHMRDDIEVIIVDDCSKKNYQDVIAAYADRISIRQLQTAYNFGPSNTRQRGLDAAEGEWICFADQDDEFLPNTLAEVKRNIVATGEQFFAIANFVEWNPETNEAIREMREYRNWTHGKFYNLDNFWVPFGLHFKKDLKTHEDIYLCSLVNCALSSIGQEPLFIDQTVYKWNHNKDSVSHRTYNGRTFVETFFGDYVEATGDCYISNYLENGDNLDPEVVIQCTIETILFSYFYIQSFKHRNPDAWLLVNEEIFRKYYVKCKRVFGMTNEVVFSYAYNAGNGSLYNDVREAAQMGVGRFVELESLSEWLERIHADIKPLVGLNDMVSDPIPVAEEAGVSEVEEGPVA